MYSLSSATDCARDGGCGPATAVVGTAAGPALGGLLAQSFGWRAIFLAQVPIALAASLAVIAHLERFAVQPATAPAPAVARARHEPVPMIALALTAAALSSVLFLLVLLLVSGWGFSPLQAAGAMMLVPAGAVAVRRVGGAALTRAAAGCALLGAGVLALAFLPSPSGWWLLAPLLVAGAGMGLALPAIAGELLHERTPRHAARLLAVRHAGIALTLLLLAPIIAVQVKAASAHAKLQGVAALLDSSVSPGEKLKLASVVASSVQSSNPRAALADVLASNTERAERRGPRRAAVPAAAGRRDHRAGRRRQRAGRVPDHGATGAAGCGAAQTAAPRASRAAARPAGSRRAVARRSCCSRSDTRSPSGLRRPARRSWRRRASRGLRLRRAGSRGCCRASRSTGSIRSPAAKGSRASSSC